MNKAKMVERMGELSDAFDALAERSGLPAQIVIDVILLCLMRQIENPADFVAGRVNRLKQLIDEDKEKSDAKD